MSGSGRTRTDRLGLGLTGPMSSLWFSERRANEVIDAALAAGVRCFDTGAFDGGGLGERRLAAALRRAGANATIMTKTGKRADRNGRLRADFSVTSIRQDVETSLNRFQRDQLDFIYLHGPSVDEAKAGLDVLMRLKADGKIGKVGICTTAAHVSAAIDLGAEAIMAAFNFLDGRAEADLRVAREKGVHVTAIAPLAQGVYERDYATVFALSDMWKSLRARRNTPELVINAAAIREAMEAATNLRPLSVAALSYVLAHDFIDLAVFTTTKPHRVASLAHAPAISAEELEALRAIGARFDVFTP